MRPVLQECSLPAPFKAGQCGTPRTHSGRCPTDLGQKVFARETLVPQHHSGPSPPSRPDPSAPLALTDHQAMGNLQTWSQPCSSLTSDLAPIAPQHNSAHQPAAHSGLPTCLQCVHHEFNVAMCLSLCPSCAVGDTHLQHLVENHPTVKVFVTPGARPTLVYPLE